MDQELMDFIATNEYGYKICPFILGGYVHCDEDCENYKENPYAEGEENEDTDSTDDGSQSPDANYAFDVDGSKSPEGKHTV